MEELKRRLLTIVSALVIACSMPVAETFAASPKQFIDVPASKHFAEAVYDLAERNLIGGYPDGTFRPGNSITRGQAAAIIAKMTNLDMSNVKNPGFKDVPTTNGYYKAIAALANKGVISGYGNGRFGPNDPIKRGQMASILVKAFDLPRDTNITNPFKDIDYIGASEDILAIYKLGITTGTAPDTFSPNAAITRGQAAKMLKATEEAKPPMMTLKASDFGWDGIRSIRAEDDTGSFRAIEVSGKEGFTEDKIQLVPLKEGTARLNFIGYSRAQGSDAAAMSKKYVVHIQKVDGKLQLTLEESGDMLPTPVTLYFLDKKVQTIALSSMNGEPLADNLPFKQDTKYDVKVTFTIDQPGQYIATLKYEGGEEVRYGIEAKQNDQTFYYDIKTLKENLSAVYEEKAEYKGKYKVLEKDAEEIAIITKDPGTNTFRARPAGEKVGRIHVAYDQTLTEAGCDGTGPFAECYTFSWIGLRVDVNRIGSIVNISITRDLLPDF
ncbi:hypothetical protein HNO89_002191 [Sporosarcina luteola]|nr:hypothetical protein [Sporosarcina luteola]